MTKQRAKLHGTVQKVIPPRLPSEPERLKPGSAVDIVLEADLDKRIKVNSPLLQSHL